MPGVFGRQKRQNHLFLKEIGLFSLGYLNFIFKSIQPKTSGVNIHLIHIKLLIESILV